MQGTDWLLSDGLFVGPDVTDEQPIQVSGVQGPTVTPSYLQGQLASAQNLHQPLYLSDPGEFSYDDMTLVDDFLSSPELADLPFDGNEHSQPESLWPLYIPDYGAVGPPTSSTVTDPSPQLPSWPVGHFQNQGLPSIKPDLTDQIVLSVDGNEHSQPGDGQDLRSVYISTNCVGTTPAPLHIPDPSPKSPAGPTVVNLEAAEKDLKAIVGSSQIQLAAASRRTTDGPIYECQFRSHGCQSTFTARHNLRYHHNSHWGLKPYKCGKCTYAAASPATTKRHRLTCKATNHSTEGNA